jgi:hypothetical protein
MKRAAYLAVFLAFLACYFTTSPDYLSDTTSYANDAILHAQGREAQFWDFGHLLWRPWAYAGHVLFGAWFARSFGDTPQQSVVRFLIDTNFVCSILFLLLLIFLLCKVARPAIAAAVTFAISCSNPFLNYSHSGASYIPALLFSLVVVYLLVEAAERKEHSRWLALLAGASFTIACALWFPFSLTGLGLLLVLFLWPSPGSVPTLEPNSTAIPQANALERARRIRLAGTFLASLAVTLLSVFAAGAAAQGVSSISQLSAWISGSGHGWSQSKTALRAITGVARIVWDFGGDTILLKRWLFRDPYNPVNVRMVLFSMGWKLAVFYLGLAAMLWALFKRSTHRRDLLLIFAGAGLPLLAFAIVLFEPSSPERFMPLLPFAGLALAAVLKNARCHMVASACVAILLVSSVVVNLAQKETVGDTRLAQAKDRMEALNHVVQPGALVFVLTFNDDLSGLPAIRPLDHSLLTSRFKVSDTVEMATRRMLRWRAEFAERTIEQWAGNHEVWISERLLAARPEARWLWVEGDDPRIRWAELPAAFSRLEFDAKVLAGNDGFLRVTQSEDNRRRLATDLAQTGQKQPAAREDLAALSATPARGRLVHQRPVGTTPVTSSSPHIPPAGLTP